MKTNILPSFILTIGLLVLLCVAYPLVMWAVAQTAPDSGRGFTIETSHGKAYSNIGQAVTSDDLFWSRPSAVDYNAAGSGASNKAATNAEYLTEVEQRIDDFMAKNPTVKKADIPVDLVTASGSGLDPNISVQAARVQIARVAKARGVNPEVLQTLVTQHIQGPLLGVFGPTSINVLELNVALEAL